MNQEVTDVHRINTITITLDHPVRPHQIGAYRKYLLSLAQQPDRRMFNRDPETDKTLRRHPLVQYRVRRGKAVLFGINAGITVLKEFLNTPDDAGRPLWSQVIGLQEESYDVKLLEQPTMYRLYNWLPFDRKDNYRAWMDESADMQQRCMLLQRVLRNHLLGFCQDMKWRPPGEVVASLKLIYKMSDVLLHRNRFLQFNIKYETNLCVPPGIAIGKGVSHGFGVQYPFALARRKHSDQAHTQTRTQSQSVVQLGRGNGHDAH